jgi:phosphoribosylglycinamide formyltransferase-1
MNVGVLVSGTGTNLQALLDAQARGALDPGRIVVVGANVPGCAALDRAAAAGVRHFVVDHRNPDGGGSGGAPGGDRRAEFDAALVAKLRAEAVDLVVLAGFMRVLTPVFLTAFPDRVINIHPSLLPAFPGMGAQAQAFHYGVKVAGCTVHFVEIGVDSGPIIAQASVPVLEGDDLDTLRARILVEEHRLLPVVVQAFAEGRVVNKGSRRIWLLPRAA